MKYKLDEKLKGADKEIIEDEYQDEVEELSDDDEMIETTKKDKSPKKKDDTIEELMREYKNIQIEYDSLFKS
ncbi:MAG: hypothetical protein IPI46_12275 [Bacteroidetes bacterium]|nr:hypothetical protein [Bacteroidota bacterium]